MKKGWQKRLIRSGFKFKPDNSIDYSEFLLQMIFWGVIVFGILTLIDRLFFGYHYGIRYYALYFIAMLIGGSIGYYIRKRKNRIK